MSSRGNLRYLGDNGGNGEFTPDRAFSPLVRFEGGTAAGSREELLRVDERSRWVDLEPAANHQWTRNRDMINARKEGVLGAME